MNYPNHSKFPKDHSHNRPKVNTNRTLTNSTISIFLNSWITGVKGNNNTSSMSKITKIKQTKKKWIESKDRWVIFCENPHSKGLIFSSWNLDFFLTIRPTNSKAKDTAKVIALIKKIKYIEGLPKLKPKLSTRIRFKLK